MSASKIKIQEKGAAVWIAIAGIILCVVISAILLVRLIGPQGFRSMPTVANLLVSVGLLPESALRQAAPFSRALNQGAGIAPWSSGRGGHRVEGAAERDAIERPPVPGWDPVVQLPAADIADLNPDQVVDLALGRVPDTDTFTPVPAPAAGLFTSVRTAAGALLDAGSPPSGAAAATTTSPAPVGVTEGAKTVASAKSAALEQPARQVLPPPPNVHASSVFAIQTAFFLDADAASSYAAALARDGIATRLVEQLDEAGRTWIYVRSPVFTDSVAALAYADTLEQKFGLSALLVSEPPAATSLVPGK